MLSLKWFEFTYAKLECYKFYIELNQVTPVEDGPIVIDKEPIQKLQKT